MIYDFDQYIDRFDMRSAKWSVPRDALSFGTADMDFLSPLEVREALRRDVDIGVYGYKSGHVEAFWDALIGWEKRRHGITLQPEYLTFTTGVIAGLAAALQCFTKPGDRVVIQPPVYGPFFSIVRESGRELVENPLRQTERGWEMDFEDLEQKASGASVLLLCSPHNPVGRVWTRAELLQCIDICRRHGLLLLCDEIHHDLILPGGRFVSAAEADPDFADVVVAGAPSKTFNLAGMATAYLSARDPARQEKLRRLNQLLHLGGGMYGYLAGEAAYLHGDEWLDQCLAYIAANDAFVRRFLAERLPEIPCSRLEGTYLCWLDLRPTGWTPEQVEQAFAREKVAPTPGSFFGAPGFTRLNIACPRSVLAEGLERMARALRTA